MRTRSLSSSCCRALARKRRRKLGRRIVADRRVLLHLDHDRVQRRVARAFFDVREALQLEGDAAGRVRHVPLRAVGVGDDAVARLEIHAGQRVGMPVPRRRLSLWPDDVPDGDTFVVEQLFRARPWERRRQGLSGETHREQRDGQQSGNEPLRSILPGPATSCPGLACRALDWRGEAPQKTDPSAITRSEPWPSTCDSASKNNAAATDPMRRHFSRDLSLETLPAAAQPRNRRERGRPRVTADRPQRSQGTFHFTWRTDWTIDLADGEITGRANRSTFAANKPPRTHRAARILSDARAAGANRPGAFQMLQRADHPTVNRLLASEDDGR